jgi:hypothetical protein
MKPIVIIAHALPEVPSSDCLKNKHVAQSVQMHIRADVLADH